MEELYGLLDKLKESIDEIQCVKDIGDIQVKLSKDKELMCLLNDYNLYRNPKVREKVIKNRDVLFYKHLENQVNYVILSINKELNEIMPEDSKEGICE